VSARDFGEPLDWGLTPETHAALAAELDDHVQALAGDRGANAAQSAMRQLTAPRARRRLTSAHLSDQVYATLHRRPSREEWRELGWLLFWFALIICSDVLADWQLHFQNRSTLYSSGNVYQFPPPNYVVSGWEQVIGCAAWLLQGVARAGFFAALALGLHRAWRGGWGVLIARLLQLKLIHTVLVLLGTILLGGVLIANDSTYLRFPAYLVELPVGLTAAAISTALVLSGVGLWLLRRRNWAVALGLLLAAGFLYCGGPAVLEEETLTTRQAVRKYMVQGRNGLQPVFVPPDNPAPVLSDGNLAQEVPFTSADRQYGYYAGADPAGPGLAVAVQSRLAVRQQPGHILSVSPYHQAADHSAPRIKNLLSYEFAGTGRTALLGPVAIAGGGIGWLAAPIPLLGLLGFFALALVMGRRGCAELAAYSVLALAAVVATILPFVVERPYHGIVARVPEALLHTPFPGFEWLAAGLAAQGTFAAENIGLALLLITGLLLSAAAPWLLTAWFLKPAQAGTPPGPEVAQ
jgi:hypothetical protein